MAHEVDDSTARKKQLDMKNGKPVDADEDDDSEDSEAED